MSAVDDRRLPQRFPLGRVVRCFGSELIDFRGEFPARGFVRFEVARPAGQEIAALPRLRVGRGRLDAIQLRFDLESVPHPKCRVPPLSRKESGSRRREKQKNKATYHRQQRSQRLVAPIHDSPPQRQGAVLGYGDSGRNFADTCAPNSVERAGELTSARI